MVVVRLLMVVEELMESLKHEIVAIERSASIDPCLGRPWGPV